MTKYKYLTEVIPCGIRPNKLKEQIDELVNLRANEGWRLHKFEICEQVGAAYLIFEKEADLLD